MFGSPSSSTAPQYSEYTRPAAGGAVSGQRTSFASVESYKADVADQIMRYNTAHTFSGRLPPMLPAIVVLSITVDKTGKVTHVAVQRSRDNDASNVALASMRRAGPLPRPFNLATGNSLTFSETFLFNADYRFQLRTLAPIQHAD
jgi:protein TonB